MSAAASGGLRFQSAILNADFESLGEIGRGGTGVVYRARERRTGREFAIKVIRSRYAEDEETISRFEREANAARILGHPNIVTVHELRRLEQGGIALVMQYVHGRTLKEIIRDHGPLPFQTVDRILRDVASALTHAHANGIVHRDVKPENIFLDEARGLALLADFGIARHIDGESSLTLTGVAIGTPAYMSPEQIDGGELDGRSDLYSLGLAGWEMLSGRRPWEGESLYGVIYRQKHEDLPPPESLRPDVPPRIANAITWTLMKEVRLRPADVTEFLRQLDTEERLFATQPRRQPVAPPPPTADPTSTMKFARPVPVPMPGTGREPLRPAPWGAADIPWDLETERKPWWRQRSAVLAAVVALPVLLVIGAVATGAISGLDNEQPVIAVRDDPVGVPIGPAVPQPQVAPPETVVVREQAAAAETETAADRESALLPEPRATEWRALRPLDPAPRQPPSQPERTEPAPIIAQTPGQDTPVARPETTAARVAEVVRAPPTPSPLPPSPSPSPRSDEMTFVAAGGTHSCALAGTGELYCWGGNDRGQLAADAGRRSTPASSASRMRFASVSAGLGHTCAISSSGEAFCWGGNANGQLGTGSAASSPSPQRVAGGRTFRAISAGVTHSCAVARDGEVYCWGGNSGGQLGDGTTVDRRVPVRLAGGGQFTAVAAGRTHSCAVSSRQEVYCWGNNSSGQLGDESTESRSYPTPVRGAIRFASIVAGNIHSCALTPGGEAYCWGDNSAGQIGDGTNASRSTPTRVAGERRFISLVAGSMHTCGITRAGDAFCWGRNTYGQLGEGSNSDRSSPVRVRGGYLFRSIDASGAHTCGVTSTGEALCWGYNVEGQLGDGTRSHRAQPVSVGRPSG